MIDKMKPGHGYVLIEIPPAISSIKTASGIELYIETSFEPERYANVWGTVISVPERLTTKSMLEDRNKMHIISSDKGCALIPGDKVYFHYLTIKNSKKNHNRGTYFEEGGKRYAILPYASLFFAVRKIALAFDGSKVNTGVIDEVGQAPKTIAQHIFEPFSKKNMEKFEEDWKELTKPSVEYVMLNEWVLVEPVRKGQHIEHIPMYGNIIVDDELSTGKIIVTTNTPYRSSEGIVRSAPADSGLNIGDRVVFEKESDVPVEYDLTRTLDKPYYRMKSEDIIARRVGINMVQLVKDYTLIIKDKEKEMEGDFYIPEIAQQKPFKGEVVMVGPNCKEVLAGERVIFDHGAYTEFPWGETGMGCLVPESKIQVAI